MKIKDLIEELENYDPEDEIVLRIRNNRTKNLKEVVEETVPSLDYDGDKILIILQSD